ncbi:MAG TPA: hypothetical protein VMJ32_10145 [Pirellulales bacterium]|nr:hypothetical protein [Pirellulales bacterium]
MPDMIAASRKGVLFPRLLIGVNTIVWRNRANAMIVCHAQQANCLHTPDQPTQILNDQQVEFSRPKLCLDLNEFGAVKGLTLAFSSDYAILDRTIVQLGHDLLGVVNLIVKGHFLLVLAATNAGYNTDYQSMAVARRELAIRLDRHWTNLPSGCVCIRPGRWAVPLQLTTLWP